MQNEAKNQGWRRVVVTATLRCAAHGLGRLTHKAHPKGLALLGLCYPFFPATHLHCLRFQPCTGRLSPDGILSMEAGFPCTTVYQAMVVSCPHLNDGVIIGYKIYLGRLPALKDMEAASSKAYAVPSVLAACQADWGSEAAAICAMDALQSACDRYFTALILVTLIKQSNEPLRRLSKKTEKLLRL